jgi:Pyruvate/2-oxoacid:ferredoxin oxidoreductase delta subunit/flavodoxin
MSLEIKHINITYFSGTGGTEKIAFLVKEHLLKNGKIVQIHSLNKKYIKNGKISVERCDLIILLYPVYAFDAPQIIYDWCKLLPKRGNIPVVIISVSGGGEVPVNNACRIGIMKKLKKLGYSVIYETMIKMPSNWIVETPEQEAVDLINELPNKVKVIIDEVLIGKEQHRKPEFIGRIITFLFKIEKIGIWLFGKSLKFKSNCSKCNLCINNCPKNNITNDEKKIQFGYSCEGCLKCVYNCPQKAIYSKYFPFIYLKNGYSIKKYEEKAKRK